MGLLPVTAWERGTQSLSRMKNKYFLFVFLFFLSVNTVINTEETGYISLNEIKPDEKETPLRFMGDDSESIGFNDEGNVGFVRRY